jgi:hypothetical protein
MRPGRRPIRSAGGINKLKNHFQGEVEHFMTQRNHAESDTRRGVQRRTYAEVRFDCGFRGKAGAIPKLIRSAFRN